MSEDESLASKIPLNLGQEASFLSDENNEEFEKFKNGHKEFFTVYHDDNIVYCDGEELTETVDTDMRKSLLIQLYLNMAAAYIKLNHHYLAYQVLDDALKLSDNVSQIYLRLAQTALSNKSSTMEQLREGLKNIEKAVSMQP
jgi:tetratricopeptide (TPR) repeat protein